MVATRGWLKQSAITSLELTKQLNDLELAAIISTDISTDGTLKGPNIHALRKIAEISVNPNRIEFEVDRTGIPVIVKTSYFPNWQVEGAEGPWRATPNLMVVVPTEKEVVLDYGRSGVEIVSMLMTFIGLVLLIRFAYKPNPLDFSSAWFDSNLILPDVEKSLKEWSMEENRSEKTVDQNGEVHT